MSSAEKKKENKEALITAHPKKHNPNDLSSDSELDAEHSQIGCTQIWNGIKTVWSLGKISALILFVIYSWVWTANQRVIGIEVLSQMCRQNYFPFKMVFHHDRLLTRQSFDSTKKDSQLDARQRLVLEDMRNGSIGHFPQGPLHTVKVFNATLDKNVNVETRNLTTFTYDNYDAKTKKNVTLPNPKFIISDSIPHAIKHIYDAEVYDKTFLLILTLTISWSSWHNDDKEHQHGDNEHDEFGEISQFHIDHNDPSKTHGHIRGYQVHPLRIIIASSIGTLYINIKSILTQRDIFANEIRLMITILLEMMLIHYMFNICSQHLENIVILKKKVDKENAKKERIRTTKYYRQFQKDEKRNKEIGKIQRDLAIKYNILEEQDSTNLDKLNKDENFWEELSTLPKPSRLSLHIDAGEMEFEQNSSNLSKSSKNISKQSDDQVSESDTLSQALEDKADDHHIQKGLKWVIRIFTHYLSLFWTDIIFALFMMSQELDDTSFLKTMELRAVYQTQTLVTAVIAVHLFINVVVVLVAFLISGLFFTQNESHLFGVTCMYFICSYEFCFELLKWGALFMGIQVSHP